MMHDVCDNLVEQKAAITCIIAPIEDYERDKKYTEPQDKFPALKDLKDEGTPIYVMAKKTEKLHQFPLDLSLPENQDPTRINKDVLFIWSKYWQIKDQDIPDKNSMLMTANAVQSMQVYEELDEVKKELELLRDDLERRDIKVRMRKGETGYLNKDQRKTEAAARRVEKEADRKKAKAERLAKRETEQRKAEEEAAEIKRLEEQGETIEL